ncbi:MAG: glycosyl hydrolase family 28-related protein, partial [Chloroflexota bacterium]
MAACDDRQLSEAQRQAGYQSQRTGVVAAVRPFSGRPTIENLIDYINRELQPAVRRTRDKVNEIYLPVVDNAPSGNPLGFYFSTETGAADPTAGRIRLNAATQDTATILRVSESNGRLADVAPWLDVMSGGATTPLGVVTLTDAINPTRFIRFDLGTMTDAGSYWNLGVTPIESSHDNPFVDGGAVVISFIPGVGGATPATIPPGAISPIAANSVLANATASSASPTAFPLSASTVLGRHSTGNIVALTGAQQGEIVRRSTSIIDTTSTGTIAAYDAGGSLTAATTQVLFNFSANVILNGMTNIAGKTIEFYCQTGMAGSVTVRHEGNGGFSFRTPSGQPFTVRANEGFSATYWLSRWFVHAVHKQPDRLGRPVYDVVLDFGAANNGVTDDLAAINLAIAAANASPGIIYLGKSHVISGALTTITGNNVVIRGRGPFNGGTSIGVTAAVAPSEVIKITGQYCRLEDFYLFAVTPYTSGQAVLVEGGYRTEIFRIRLEDFANGIEVKTSTLTNIIDCELADLAGTYGIWVHGTSLGQTHATYIEHVIGNTTRSTTNTWFLHDSYAHTMRLLDCAALNGGYGLRVIDSLSSGADVPHFTRAVNLECDHNNLGGIVLAGGEQAEFEQLFVTSVIAGPGFDAQSTYNGDIRIDGAFFFATSREAIKLAAPHAILSGIIIGKASNGNTNTYDAIAVASNTTDFTINGCSASVSYHGATVVSRYALSIGSGCDDYVVTNNRFSDNVTGAILNTPGVSSTRIVRHNTPEIPLVVTESSGGTLNNYALSANADILKVTATATISGIAGGSVGRRIIVANGAAGGSGVTVTLRQFITSTAGNRFLLPGAADLVLNPGDAIEMQHGVVSTEWSGIDVATTLADGSVTLAKLANLAQSRIIGRAEAAGTGVPQALTPAQVVAIIDAENATWTGVHSFTGSSHTVNVTGAVNIDADAASRFITSVGNLTLQTTQAGSRVIVSGADDVLIEAV